MISATKLANKTKKKEKYIKRFVAESETKIDVTKMYLVSRIERKKIAQSKTHPKEKNAKFHCQPTTATTTEAKFLYTDWISSWKVNFIATKFVTQLNGVFPLAGLSYFYLLRRIFIVNRFESLRSFQGNSSRRKTLRKNRRSISTKIGRVEHRGLLVEQFICDWNIKMCGINTE